MQKRPVEVLYYDGSSAIAHPALIRPLDQHLIQLSYIDDENRDVEIPYKMMAFIGAVGRRPAIVELPNDARIEFIGRVPHWFAKPQKAIYEAIWQLERSPAQLLTLLVLALVMIFSVVKWVIPWGAKQVAAWVPDNTVQRIGDVTEQNLVKRTEVSALSADYQSRIRQRFQQEIAENPHAPAKLIFRKGKELGANALAIPNNTILVTDELVAIAENEEEVLAVLAHEQGHIVRQHAMQKLIAASSVAMAWEMIFQDGSSMLTAAAVKLSDADYSKHLEYDADDYAMKHLYGRGISSIHLSNFLQRVENLRLSQPKKEELVIQIELEKWLNTHPEEQERIERIHAFDAKMSKQAVSHD